MTFPASHSSSRGRGMGLLSILLVLCTIMWHSTNQKHSSISHKYRGSTTGSDVTWHCEFPPAPFAALALAQSVGGGGGGGAYAWMWHSLLWLHPHSRAPLSIMSATSSSMSKKLKSEPTFSSPKNLDSQWTRILIIVLNNRFQLVDRRACKINHTISSWQLKPSLRSQREQTEERFFDMNMTILEFGWFLNWGKNAHCATWTFWQCFLESVI